MMIMAMRQVEENLILVDKVGDRDVEHILIWSAPVDDFGSNHSGSVSRLV